MDEILKSWLVLQKTDYAVLGRDSQTIHRAAQLLAYAGKRYIPEKDDDSHTACYWLADKKMLVTKPIQSPQGMIRVGLTYQNPGLCIVNDDSGVTHEIDLQGITRQFALTWLAEHLQKYGLDTAGFDGRMHYEIPDSHNGTDALFTIEDAGNPELLANYRTDGDLVLKHFAAMYPSSHEALVWPHHFDEGVYIPVEFDGDTVTHSITIGLAVPDNYYDNPYFYVTAWKKDGLEYDNLPDLTKAGKWHTHEWTGQVLESRNLTSLRSEAQAETTLHFMEQAIRNALELLQI